MAIVALGEREKARVRQWHQGEAPRRAYGAEGFVVSHRHAVGGGNGHEELAVEIGPGRGGPDRGRRHRQGLPSGLRVEDLGSLHHARTKIRVRFIGSHAGWKDRFLLLGILSL